MKNISSAGLILFSLIFSTNLFAGQPLSKDQVNTLIRGKTIHAEHIKKGFKFTVFFGENGKAIRNRNGNIIEGTYSFRENMHCVNFGGGEKCATIEDNDDGSYKRLKNGKKHVITWNKVTQGKNL